MLKKSYDSVVKENQEHRKYIENIKIRYQQYQQRQQQQYIDREREYYKERQQQKHKKVIYQGKPDSEPEVDENGYLSEEIEEDVEKQKPEKRTKKKK